MKEYVSKIKELKDNISIDLKGNIADIIEYPKKWADTLSEMIVEKNAEKIIIARKLGESFANEINTND